jgi:hypothetical protein
MTETRLFTVETSSVADGSSNEVTEADNDSFVIEKVKVLDEEGNVGDTTNLTIQIGGNSITDQSIPVSELQQTHGDLPVLHVNWPANNQLRFSYTNEAGGSITLKFVVYVYEAGSDMSDMGPGEVLSTPLMERL